jgi:hypothetical protein
MRDAVEDEGSLGLALSSTSTFCTWPEEFVVLETCDQLPALRMPTTAQKIEIAFIGL